MAPRFLEKLAPRRRGGRVQPRFAGEGNGPRRVEISISPEQAAPPAPRGNSAPTVPILLASHSKIDDRVTLAAGRDHRLHHHQLAQASTDTIEEQLGGGQACADDGRKRKIMGGLGGAVKRMMSNLCRKAIGPHPKIPRHQASLSVIFEPVVEEGTDEMRAATVEQDEEQSVSFFSLRLDAIFEEQLARCVSLGRLEVGEELIVAAQNLIEAVRRTRGLTLNEMARTCPEDLMIQSPTARRSSTIVCEPFLGGGGREEVVVVEGEERGTEDGDDEETGDRNKGETADPSSAAIPSIDPLSPASLESLNLEMLLSDAKHPFQSACRLNEVKDGSERASCTSLDQLVEPSLGSPHNIIAVSLVADTAAVTATSSFSASSLHSSHSSKISVSVGERQRSPRLEQLIALFEGSSLALTM